MYIVFTNWSLTMYLTKKYLLYVIKYLLYANSQVCVQLHTYMLKKKFHLHSPQKFIFLFLGLVRIFLGICCISYLNLAKQGSFYWIWIVLWCFMKTKLAAKNFPLNKIFRFINSSRKIEQISSKFGRLFSSNCVSQ